MATTQIEISCGGKLHTGAFIAPGGRLDIQVNRDTEDAVWVEAGADGENWCLVAPEEYTRDAVFSLLLPAGMCVRVAAVSPIRYAAVIAAKEVIDLSQTYYPNAVQDYDGNWYDAVIIGEQVWTAENLRVTHYPNGDEITYGGYNPSSEEGRYYYPNGDSANKMKYGLLYTWFAAMGDDSVSGANGEGVRGISPIGWHIPSYAESRDFSIYLSRNSYYASSLSSKEGWAQSNVSDSPGYDLNENNSTGFNFMPAGVGFSDSFTRFGEESYMATTQIGDSRTYSSAVGEKYNQDLFGHVWSLYAHTGRSVRCICDMTPESFRQWYAETYKTNSHEVE